MDKTCSSSEITAGLEDELAIAVGARVMLRRNIGTKRVLVNISIGTVTAADESKVRSYSPIEG